MDFPSVQIQMDPAAPSDAPSGRDRGPVKRRDEQGNAENTAAAGALTASFAELLQAKKRDALLGAEKSGKRAEDAPESPGGRFAALKALPGQAAAQAKGAVEDAKAKAGARPERGPVGTAEQSLLKDLVQKGGSLEGQKKAAAKSGSVNGETLSRPVGIGAVQSMAAKEGEVLKILAGGEGAPAPPKGKIAKAPKPAEASAAAEPAAAGGKASPVVAAAEGMRREFAALAEDLQEKPTAAGQGKRPNAAGGTVPEARDASAGAGTPSPAAQARGIENPTPVRPQAVLSQVLEGAVQVLRNGSGRMVLNLQPPRLGTLDLDVVVQDNRVRMVMLADNQEVKQLLQAGMDDLRSALQDKGFEIDRLEVLVQNRPDGDGDGFRREAGFARGDSRGGNERKHGQDGGTPEPGIPVRPSRAGDDGLSVFA